MENRTRTVFDRILDGEIPSHRVYEDEHTLAFLDIFPLSEGHTLVIPKERRAHLHELSPDAGAALGRALVIVARAVLSATGATTYNVLQNNGAESGQSVDHVHFHVIPRLEGRGLGVTWKPGQLAPTHAKDLCARITAAIQR